MLRSFCELSSFIVCSRVSIRQARHGHQAGVSIFEQFCDLLRNISFEGVSGERCEGKIVSALVAVAESAVEQGSTGMVRVPQGMKLQIVIDDVLMLVSGLVEQTVQEFVAIFFLGIWFLIMGLLEIAGGFVLRSELKKTSA